MICFSRSLFVCVSTPGVSRIGYRSLYLQHSKFYSGGSIKFGLLAQAVPVVFGCTWCIAKTNKNGLRLRG